MKCRINKNLNQFNYFPYIIDYYVGKMTVYNFWKNIERLLLGLKWLNK